MKQDEISSSISRDRKKRSGREERQSANHGAAKSKESLEEGVEGGDSVLDTFGSLHATAVESNVRVGELLDERDESRDDGVESVGCNEGPDVRAEKHQLS
jgi:hypothetical protein